MKQRGFRYCRACKTKLQKWSKTSSGRQRWHCRVCSKSLVLERLDVAQKHQLGWFVGWLLGMTPLAKLESSVSTFQRQTNWCWKIYPAPLMTGEIYDYLVIDAKRVGRSICCIVASQYFVRMWRYGVRENSELWMSTLNLLPKPSAVVCDGQKGILKALTQLWSGVIIQRCHFHVRQNIRTKLTLNPKTMAGQDLGNHMCTLKWVDSLTLMQAFIDIFNQLFVDHKDFLGERSKNHNPKTGQRKWWYTHRSVRSAYRQVDNLIKSEQLFAYILHPELNLPRTTNQLEGGVNSPLQELIHRHRGMKPQHQTRLADWYLDSRTEAPYFRRKPTRNGY